MNLAPLILPVLIAKPAQSTEAVLLINLIFSMSISEFALDPLK